MAERGGRNGWWVQGNIMSSTATERPFRIQSGRGGVTRFLFAAPCALAERALGLRALNSVYDAIQSTAEEGEFCPRALEVLDTALEVRPDELARIPRSGPLVVVSNHPFGGLDGVALIALLRRVRPDIKVLANFLLNCIPELRSSFFFVNPFGAQTPAARDIGALRCAVQWVRGGGVLGVFPAGEVAHRTWRNRCITDPAWNPAAARIIQRTEATVLPVFFSGSNSTLFQYAGMVHPRLRTALLPRELLHKRHHPIHVRVGTPIPFRKINRFAEPAALTDYLRLRTFILRGGSDGASLHVENASRTAAKKNPATPTAETPIVARASVEELRTELFGLPDDTLMAQVGPLAVYCATAPQIPAILREIGRLREVTFRAVGEGTGRDTDLDRFDQHYRHLFIWNRKEDELVGAYRLGTTDDILQEHGVAGFYTNTLFDFDAELVERIGPALEMGRSFVSAPYQKSHLPLMLLWKGIGRFVCRHPRYRKIFGAVSISDDFQSMTKQLLMTFLDANQYRSELAALVHAKHPPRRRAFGDFPDSLVSSVVHDLDDVDELVAEIEEKNRSMPVLLRQYLKLNARLLGFNIDPDFGDVLDGLVLIDLLCVDKPVLDRYLGKDEAEAFRTFHLESK